MQSCATCAPTISRQRLPIRVTCPASSARWTVQFSRNTLPSPISVTPGMLGHVDVLRHAAQHRAFEHQIVAAQHRARFHRHAAGQVTAVAQHDAGLHDAERADTHIGSKLGMRTDDSKRVNRHGWVLSEKAGCAAQAGERVSCRPPSGLRYSAGGQSRLYHYRA